MSQQTVIITGATGQLGHFLISHLQACRPDLRIVATYRVPQWKTINPSNVTWELLDLADQSSIEQLIREYTPDYFVNLAGFTSIQDSWRFPKMCLSANLEGVLCELDAIRQFAPFCRYLNCGSSDEFGACTVNHTQNESTPLRPSSPYGTSKVAARNLIHSYRARYGLWAIQPWLFNSESEFRSPDYVMRKICLGMSNIAKKIAAHLEPGEPLLLGNVDVVRSWCFAGDVADALWRSLTKIGDPIDYIISHPEAHSIRDIVSSAARAAGLKSAVWNGTEFETLDEHRNPTCVLRSSFLLTRPTDASYLNGDSSALRCETGWQPTLSFDQLVARMVKASSNNL